MKTKEYKIKEKELRRNFKTLLLKLPNHAKEEFKSIFLNSPLHDIPLSHFSLFCEKYQLDANDVLGIVFTTDFVESNLKNKK